jgi:predicted TIM-barrel fold metal-dependent hydrolase
MATALLGERTRHEIWSGSIIDVDVHAAAPTLDQLAPYLDDVWRQHVRERAWTGPSDAYTYPPQHPASARSEWRPADGRAPASDVSLLREHILDPWDVDAAIVNCVYPIDMGHPDMAAALARAVNDWLLHEWLEQDDRLRASLVLPIGDPAAAVREVERLGGHPGFVQALVPVRTARPLGHRAFHPLYATLSRHDLVLGLHWGGLNEGAPISSSGWPSWYAEEYVAELQTYEAQLLNIIAEGVFKACPDLRVSLLEIGFAWLPTWGWRMDKECKGMRGEIPWVDRRPLSIIRDHGRISAAPVDAGPPEQMEQIVRWLGSEDLLMFATDYPHMHDDDLDELLAVVPKSMRSKLMADSARRWYGL